MSDRKYITHWTIKVTWNDGTEEYLPDCPDWCAVEVDSYIDLVEVERNEEEGLV